MRHFLLAAAAAAAVSAPVRATTVVTADRMLKHGDAVVKGGNLVKEPSATR